MAIKVTVGEHKTQNEKLFPKLMIANSNGDNDEGIIVLFLSLCEGFVIQTVPKSAKKLGYYSTNFIMSCFDDYNEPITLQNE